MRVIVVRHHDVDDPGFIGAAFAARGGDLDIHLFPDEGTLPSLDGADHIVVLGAKWSVYDDATIGDWMGQELDWLREADARGIPVLGICFGAQALSAAHGGSVEPVGRFEIGWTKVDSTDTDIIEPGPWLEFHRDRCVPPAQARVLATTEVGVQAFVIGANLAVQFHPEVDGPQLRRWLDDADCAAEAAAAGQEEGTFMAETIAEEGAAAARADRLVGVAIRIAQEHASA
jgi:GMP synthase-like glutamine amidotransferase